MPTIASKARGRISTPFLELGRFALEHLHPGKSLFTMLPFCFVP